MDASVADQPAHQKSANHQACPVGADRQAHSQPAKESDQDQESIAWGMGGMAGSWHRAIVGTPRRCQT